MSCLKVPFARFFILTVLAFVFAVSAPVAHANTIATVDEIQGNVLVLKGAGAGLNHCDRLSDSRTKWQPLSQVTSLENGDAVKTLDGSAVLLYAGTANFKVEPNSVVSIKEQPGNQDIFLCSGALHGTVHKDKAAKPFDIVTPTASLKLQGGDISLSVGKDGFLNIQHGNVFVVADNPCADKDLETAAAGNEIPDTEVGDDAENEPDEGPQSLSPVL